MRFVTAILLLLVLAVPVLLGILWAFMSKGFESGVEIGTEWGETLRDYIVDRKST